jgi:hypothetical protein
MPCITWARVPDQRCRNAGTVSRYIYSQKFYKLCSCLRVNLGSKMDSCFVVMVTLSLVRKDTFRPTRSLGWRQPCPHHHMLCGIVGESQAFVFAVEHAFLKEFSLAVGHIAHGTVCLSLIVLRWSRRVSKDAPQLNRI